MSRHYESSILFSSFVRTFPKEAYAGDDKVLAAAVDYYGIISSSPDSSQS